MSTIPMYGEPGYGNYTSVNDLASFAHLVEANGGPFDPKELVHIQRNSSGHYTIDGVQSLFPTEDGQFDMAIWVEPDMFRDVIGADVSGFYATPGYGFVFVDMFGSRYALLRTNGPDGRHFYYAADYVNASGALSIYLEDLYVPSDHPVAHTWRSRPPRVTPEVTE